MYDRRGGAGASERADGSRPCPGGRLSTASMTRALLVKLAPDAVPKGGLVDMLAAGNAAATLGAWVAHERRDVKGRTPRKHVV